MGRLNIEYSDIDDRDKRSVARMVSERKCIIVKVINKHREATHQGKVTKKRTKDEVNKLPKKGTSITFKVGNSGRFTREGKKYQVTDKNKLKKENYCKIKIVKLGEQS